MLPLGFCFSGFSHLSCSFLRQSESSSVWAGQWDIAGQRGKLQGDGSCPYGCAILGTWEPFLGRKRFSWTNPLWDRSGVQHGMSPWPLGWSVHAEQEGLRAALAVPAVGCLYSCWIQGCVWQGRRNAKRHTFLKNHLSSNPCQENYLSGFVNGYQLQNRSRFCSEFEAVRCISFPTSFFSLK